MKTLHARKDKLANNFVQLTVLNNTSLNGTSSQKFSETIDGVGLYPLTPVSLDTLQVNLGYMCNQTCNHCHVDAGPDREEIMSIEIMQLILRAAVSENIKTIDLTGGAPEMNPHFRWFVAELGKLGKHIIVRSNLTIIVSNPKYHDLPEFFKEHQVEVISSLPFYNERRTDSQRGEGVFEKSIRALKMLNAVGYGVNGSGLLLNLVYNPAGAFLPPSQDSLEKEFKLQLQKKYGVEFNRLFTITNMPISRFLEYLLTTNNYEQYMDKLINAFNPSAAMGVMCRNILSIGWDGRLFDCDFNQMLNLGVNSHSPEHIKDFDLEKLETRHIVVNQHCYGCTAGAGSSCGGIIAE